MQFSYDDTLLAVCGVVCELAARRQRPALPTWRSVLRAAAPSVAGARAWDRQARCPLVLLERVRSDRGDERGEDEGGGGELHRTG
jgi:hypothetical protein